MDNSSGSFRRQNAKVVDCVECGSKLIVLSKAQRAVHLHSERCSHRQDITFDASTTDTVSSPQVRNDSTEEQVQQFQQAQQVYYPEERENNIIYERTPSNRHDNMYPDLNGHEDSQQRESRRDNAGITHEDDELESRRLSEFLQSAQRLSRPLGNPLNPEYEDQERRRSSFFEETDVPYQRANQRMSQSHEMGPFMEDLADKHAENGFYLDNSGSVVCFHCGISFREKNLYDPTWDIEVEHARGSPCCSYWRSLKGEDFIRYMRAQGDFEVIL